jgi:hypothetical protein
VENQLYAAVNTSGRALLVLLVGGFGESKYLFELLKARLEQLKASMEDKNINILQGHEL